MLATGAEEASLDALDENRRQSCSKAWRALRAVGVEAQAQIRAEWLREAASGLPMGLERLHPSWIHEALAGEPAYLLRTLWSGLPQAAGAVSVRAVVEGLLDADVGLTMDAPVRLSAGIHRDIERLAFGWLEPLCESACGIRGAEALPSAIRGVAGGGHPPWCANRGPVPRGRGSRPARAGHGIGRRTVGARDRAGVSRNLVQRRSLGRRGPCQHHDSAFRTHGRRSIAPHRLGRTQVRARRGKPRLAFQSRGAPASFLGKTHAWMVRTHGATSVPDGWPRPNAARWPSAIAAFFETMRGPPPSSSSVPALPCVADASERGPGQRQVTQDVSINGPVLKIFERRAAAQAAALPSSAK